ncbi:MAG: enoyl-CoA hydratase/isomerase family protein [Proteobacteria bacterium]|nr:enoyl-CoA hydratase/isomerase family protein [Pseudomonadota bacterium]
MSIRTELLKGETGTLAKIILDNPKSLNALTTRMIESMQQLLDQWSNDDEISAVWIEGAGEKAFCAGGDVVMLYHSMLETKPGDIPIKAAEFFTKEYHLDYSIHTYEKPVIIWADGIVMGGGLGVAVGGSHRIVTEKSMIAMPEVSIGLYPDVAASWFFNRMPGNCAPFLGMTGARMNAADAIFCKLADHAIKQEHKKDIIEQLLFGDMNQKSVKKVLNGFESAELLEGSILRAHFDQINNLMSGVEVSDIVDNFKSLETDNKWLAFAKKTLLTGCPITLRLVDEQIKRAKHMSLKEVFKMELIMSVQCAVHPDLQEGIRALLIDKDGMPKWSVNSVDEITDELIAEYFRSH